nr:immunoglobulin heavy chain junction region [Mus musculus]
CARSHYYGSSPFAWW